MSYPLNEMPVWYKRAVAGQDIHASESVTEGHPDKLMDIVVDAILDDIFCQSVAVHERLVEQGDPRANWASPKHARVALDGAVKGALDGDDAGGYLSLVGEVTPPFGVTPRYEEIARRVIKDIGYTDPDAGFWHGLTRFETHITQQSGDIARGVNGDDGEVKGAGDQGICYGYATKEHPSLMPVPIQMAHALTAKLTEVRKNSQLPWLRPDGKSQIGIKYDGPRPVEVAHITLAAAHEPSVSIYDVRKHLYEAVILPIMDQFGFGLEITERELLEGNGLIIINGAGPWSGPYGPTGDSGEVGRKLGVDTYGEEENAGGGALSGKDPSKVDRSAKYGLRAAARVLVDEGYADRLKIGATYTIGHMHPNSLRIESFGTEHRPKTDMFKRIVDVIGLSVPDMIREMRLFEYRNYQQTARNGHFGHDFPWEKFGNNS